MNQAATLPKHFLKCLMLLYQGMVHLSMNNAESLLINLCIYSVNIYWSPTVCQESWWVFGRHQGIERQKSVPSSPHCLDSIWILRLDALFPLRVKGFPMTKAVALVGAQVLIPDPSGKLILCVRKKHGIQSPVCEARLPGVLTITMPCSVFLVTWCHVHMWMKCPLCEPLGAYPWWVTVEVRPGFSRDLGKLFYLDGSHWVALSFKFVLTCGLWDCFCCSYLDIK